MCLTGLVTYVCPFQLLDLQVCLFSNTLIIIWMIEVTFYTFSIWQARFFYSFMSGMCDFPDKEAMQEELEKEQQWRKNKGYFNNLLILKKISCFGKQVIYLKLSN